MIQFFDLSTTWISTERGCSRDSDSPSQPVDSVLLESSRSYLFIQFGPDFAILLRCQNVRLRTVVRRGPRSFVGCMPEMEICCSKDNKAIYYDSNPNMFVLLSLTLRRRVWRWIWGRKDTFFLLNGRGHLAVRNNADSNNLLNHVGHTLPYSRTTNTAVRRCCSRI